MDFGRGLAYVRQDPNWLVKTLLGSVLSLVPILNFAAVGYSMDVVWNVHGGREVPLPEWGDDFGQRWVRGLLAVLIQLIYLLPLVLVACGLMALTAAGARTAGEDAAQAGVGLVFLCLVPLSFVVGLVLSALALVAQTRYAITDNFGEAVQIGAVVSELRSNFGRWMGVVGMATVVAFAFSVFGLATCGLGFLLIFYILLAQSHWMAQAARESESRADMTARMV